MKNKLIEVFCEIIEDNPRVTLFSVISLIDMFFVIVIESIGLTTWATELIAISIVLITAVGLCIKYMNEEF
jgi:hypothetical protein